MSIEKQIVTANGVASFHRVMSLNVTAHAIQVVIHNYNNREGAQDESGLLWQDYVELATLPTGDFALTADNVVASVEKYLATESVTQYLGGTFLREGAEPDLETLKVMKWSEIKLAREQAESAGYIVEGFGTFDSDPEARANITGSVTAALIAKLNNAPFQVNWTLADNSVVTLDADGMVLAGLEGLQHINKCHEQSRKLRVLIENANDAEELARVVWGLVVPPEAQPETQPEGEET